MRRFPLAFPACVALLSACSAPRLDVTPRYGTFDVSGDILAHDDSVNVTARADLETAGLQKDDSVIGGRIDLDMGPTHLTLSAQQSSHDGDGVLDADITLGGVTVNATDPVESKLDLGLYAFDLTFDLIPTELVEFGIGFGVVGADLQAAFRDKITNQVAETDQLAPIPVLAARLGLDLGRLELEALASGLKFNRGDDSFQYVDVEAQAKLRLLGGDRHLAGHIAAGYRWVDLQLEYTDGSDAVDADAQFSGPWLGLTLSL